METIKTEITLVLKHTDADAEEIQNYLPFGKVSVASEKSAGIGAEEIAQQILIGVAGAYTYEQLSFLFVKFKELIRNLIEKKENSGKSVEVIVSGISHKIENDQDIDKLIADIREEIELD